MRLYDRIYATVDLDAVESNMKQMQHYIGRGAGIMGVVKTDGYGHGAVPIAKTIDPYVSGYASATLDEAVILRRHGIDKPILVLGTVYEARYQEMLDYRIMPSIYQYQKAKTLSELASEREERAKIHIALDTGMSRIGMRPDKESAETVERIAALPGIEIEGLFTHFAKADEREKGPAREQLQKYLDFDEMLRGRGIRIPVRHCSNSAGILELAEGHLDAVRAGIAIYGLYPSDEVSRESIRLKPAMELKSYVNYIKTIKAGTQVSYGGLFEAAEDMKIATIPVGYGDGYPRSLSGKGSVIIAGKRAPILGRICMDQMMVDVSGIPEIAEDDQVTLLGRCGDEEITMEELAKNSGVFHYELPSILGKRVPRVYVKNGKVVGKKDYFNDVYTDFMA